ncbi:YihY/virulence factor BrkB family protein [Methyloradius palustris]|uniref:Membrane protein n=1 Tax=Methyloradius palustris TaxID=2778876 RepID=A0A8D5GDA0_9PROT|nr:YihY/virulence factor BrkB family protein [Methyloradius palustris]BCM25338.1 membrane protein [Methyloradius palustris]
MPTSRIIKLFQPLRSHIKNVQLFLMQCIESWIEHRAGSKGAALAFYALFSMAPILILMIALLGYVFNEQIAQTQVIAEVSRLVGETGGKLVESLLIASSNNASSLIATVLASIFIFVGATSVFSELKASLDEIWEVKKIAQIAPFKQLLITRLVSFSMVMILSALLLISLTINAAINAVGAYSSEFLGHYSDIFSVATSFVSFCVIASIFAIIYKTLPDVLLSWKDAMVGAVFTAILFSFGSYLAGIYISKSAVTSSFGAAGSLIALLLWIYYSAQIFFFGAEVTRQYAITYGSLKTSKLKKILSRMLNRG